MDGLLTLRTADASDPRSRAQAGTLAPYACEGGVETAFQLGNRLTGSLGGRSTANDDVVSQGLKQHADPFEINAIADLPTLPCTLWQIDVDDVDCLKSNEVLTCCDSLRPDRTNDVRGQRSRVTQEPSHDVDTCGCAHHLVGVGYGRRQRIDVVDGGGHQHILSDDPICLLELRIC